VFRVLVAATVLSLAVAAPNAYALHDPVHTEQLRAETFMRLYAGQPAPAAATSQDVAWATTTLDNIRALPSTEDNKSIWRSAGRVVTKAGMFPKVLKGVGQVALAEQTFEVGWKVGSLFADVLVPAGNTAPNPPGDFSFKDYQLVFGGSGWFGGAEYDSNRLYLMAVQQYDGGTSCCFVDFNLPSLERLTNVPSGMAAESSPHRVVNGNPWYSVSGNPNEVFRVGLIHPHGSEAVTTTTAPLTLDPATDYGANVQTQLDDPEAAPVRTWLNEELDPTWDDPPPPPPILVPAPLDGETYPDYVTRLQALGLVGNAVALSETALDPTKGPRVVVRTTPAAGSEVTTGTQVTVYYNPETAREPSTTGGSNPFGWSAPAIPPLDLTPLNQTIPCGAFPFGIFCWIHDALGGWVGSSSCPQPEFPTGSDSINGGSFAVDMCIGEPALVILRPLILITTAIGLAWLFASTAMGLGTARDDD